MGHECGLTYFVLEERDLLHSLHISSKNASS
jgi:hypothetical protein